MMGLAFGLGGIAAPLIGRLAEVLSVRSVLTWVSLISLVPLIAIARFPSDQNRLNSRIIGA